MLKGKFLSSYRSSKGNTVFRYEVSGKDEDVQTYKDVQGDKLRVDETSGKPIWFTTRFAGNTADIIIVGKDADRRAIADMSAFEQAASLAKQFGGDLGQELAKKAAEQLLGGNHQQPVVEQTAAEPPF